MPHTETSHMKLIIIYFLKYKPWAWAEDGEEFGPVAGTGNE